MDFARWYIFAVGGGDGELARELATGNLVSEGGAWLGYHAARLTESFDIHCSYCQYSENDHAGAPVRLKAVRK